MRTALVVPADDTPHLIDLDENGDSLAMLQRWVGGYVGCVSLDDDLDMWVNEEGLLDDNPTWNPAARLIAHAFRCGQHPIAGDVVFTGGVDSQGATLGLPSGPARVMVMLIGTLVEIATAHPVAVVLYDDDDDED